MEVPPEGLKPIIEKTIEYVVRNGVSLEAELRKRNIAGGNKFGFLMPDHPFNSYYRQQLNLKLNTEEIETLRILRMKERKKNVVKEKVARNQTTIRTLTLTEKIQQEIKLNRIPKEKYIRAPKINKYTVTIPKGIKHMQIDLIKLTAQFVARNGRKFLTNLTSKEKNNTEFEFLDPIHPFFPYFQKLVNAYCLCIVPPKDLIEKIEHDQNIEEALLHSIGESEYLKQEEDRKIQKEADAEEERIQMQLIDWHRFVVLETLDFNPGEIYPPPGLNLQQIDEILNIDNRAEIKIALAKDVLDQEINFEKNKSKAIVEKNDHEEINFSDGHVEIEKENDKQHLYNTDDLTTIPQAMSNQEQKIRNHIENLLKQRASKSNFVESPFTGDMIPVSEISEHIRIMLLNPQWKEQKELLINKMRATSFADNIDIVKNLGKFSEKRENIKIETLNWEKDEVKKNTIKRKEKKNEIRIIIRFPNSVCLTYETTNITVTLLKRKIYKKIKKIINIDKCIIMTTDNQILKNKSRLSRYNLKDELFFKY